MADAALTTDNLSVEHKSLDQSQSVAVSICEHRSVVLVVEDDLDLQEAIVDTLELADFDVVAASSAELALDKLASTSVDMVISDVNMGGMDGHQLLEKIKASYPMLPVLLITAFGSIERSVSAIQAGAVDYLVKPFEPGVLIALARRYAMGSVDDAEQPICVAAASRELFQMARRVAETDSTVLLAGESGVGKEVVARYIHRHSSRSENPFIAINCAAIPETMLEATLFGHEKGAYTGAHQSAPGKFEQANGGTLLLDEVSEMDLGLQAKLLRVIQEREVERVGGRKLIRLDVRIIATTNRQLRDYVQQGKFREDLFYRLSVFPLQCPSLASRPEDIVPLARHLLKIHSSKMGRSGVEFTVAAESALVRHHWPGNVRELDNVIQRALILQGGQLIDAANILFDQIAVVPTTDTGVFPDSQSVAAQSDRQEVITESVSQPMETDLRNREFEIIARTLKELGGSKKDTAAKLGISPRTLRYKMAKMRDCGMVV